MSVLLAAAAALLLGGCQNPFARSSSSLADRDEPPRRERMADRATSLEGQRPEDVAERFARGRQPSLGFDEGGEPPADSPESAPGVRALLEDGHRALARGEVQQARALYEQVLVQQPRHAEAHHRLAILADRDGHYVAAEHHYHAALRGKPDDADLLSDLGYSYFLQGRPGESEHYLQEALRRDPQHPHARENLNLLRDPARAAMVLRELQGPQAESTLARLFPMGSAPMGLAPMGPSPQYASARPPYHAEPGMMPGGERMAAAGRSTDPPSDQPPPGVDVNQWLWQKMQDAGTENVAQRSQSQPQPQPAWPRESDPPAGPGYRPVAPSTPPVSGPSGEFTAAQIRSAFEAIDRGMDPRTTSSVQPSAQPAIQPRDWPASNPPVRQAVAWEMAPPAADPYATSYGAPNPSSPPVVIEPRPLSADRPAGRPVDRAAAPQWDSVPRDWPDVPVSANNPRPAAPVGTAASMSFEEAARRAAELGMQTGPGSMFPSFAAPPAGSPPAGSPSVPPAASNYPGPTPRALPGTAVQPGVNWADEGRAVETRFDHRGPIRQIAAEQPADRESASMSPAHPLDEYERMRREHAAEFNADLQNSAAGRGHWNGGPPARPPLPSSFDPRQRPWPEYGPDDQNLHFQNRGIEPPAADPRRPAAAPAPQYGGQYGNAPADYTGGIAHDYGTGAAPSYDPGSGTGSGTSYGNGYDPRYEAASPPARY